MNVAVDFDGTIDSFPREFQSLISALCGAGHQVYVLTGSDGQTVTQEVIDGKKAILAALGITVYTAVVVVPDPHDANKAQFIKDNSVTLFLDNNRDNIKCAVKETGCASLLLWNSKL